MCETEYRRFPVVDNNGLSPGYLEVGVVITVVGKLRKGPWLAFRCSLPEVARRKAADTVCLAMRRPSSLATPSGTQN
jgi:hypothetical protein